MEFLKAARYTLIGSLSLLAVACTETTAQHSADSDDNGANCGGTAANQKNCVNNQNRMNNDAAPLP